MISFEGVTKTYPGGTTAVDELTLDIPEGSFTVFVGPSGCGKTTSLRMINRMVEPTSGRVLVAGRDVAEVEPVELRLGIGYVIQHAGLLPHRTVLDNVAQVLRLKGVSKKEARARAFDAMERVQLRPELTYRYPAQLSGGQQQRVGVARALAADPPILLMDEPFSAVDAVVRDELQQEMLRIQRELRKTIVFVTHDIDEALRLGDRIAVFAPGGVMQQYADAETVLTQPASQLVAELVGRDRGFRALSFASAEELPVEPLPARDADGAFPVGEWRILVDDHGAPRLWVHPSGERRSVGSVAPRAGTMRAALDAVLSAPGGNGAVVDADGRLTGIFRAEAVYRLLAAQKAQQAPQ